MTAAVVGQIESQASVVAPLVRVPVRESSRAPQPDHSEDAGKQVSQASTPQAEHTQVVINDRVLRLTVKPDTHEVIAAVVDPNTDQVIREIPPEEMRRAAAVIRAILGQLVDKLV